MSRADSTCRLAAADMDLGQAVRRSEPALSAPHVIDSRAAWLQAAILWFSWISESEGTILAALKLSFSQTRHRGSTAPLSQPDLALAQKPSYSCEKPGKRQDDTERTRVRENQSERERDRQTGYQRRTGTHSVWLMLRRSAQCCCLI